MDELSISVKDMSKLYKLYNKPIDRLKESISLSKKNYHKSFYALKDISFNVNKGEAVGIIGKNGSGKSTLLKIITGVLNQTSGSVYIKGKISALLELGAGFNQEFTGIENIYLNGTILGYSNTEIEKKMDEIIKFADIGEFINQPIKRYSSGMFVRLAFAVATNVDPDILIIDEALAVGDTRFQLKCMEKFMEFKKSSKTILFVSHDTNSIKRFCDRSIWINEGQLMDDGESDIIIDRYTSYLKKENSDTTDKFSEINQENDKKIDYSEIDIAKIEAVKLLDREKKEISKIAFNQKVHFEIEYIVKDVEFKNPVLGIAIFDMNNFYVCGINTLLDKYKVNWEKGRNFLNLTINPFNLTGGQYYFDVAIFDSTASVKIDYQAKYSTFFVEMKYCGEGIVILEHEWS